ncbi:hypothetical protein C2E23DRAFT_689380, partial [Lenzites betulinus]
PEPDDPEYGRHEQTGAPPVARLEELREQQAFIEALKTATLDKSGMSKEAVARLRNPRRHLPDLSAPENRTLRYSLRMWLANGHSEKSYHENRFAAMENTDGLDLPTLDAMEDLVAELTGVEPIKTDMCVNSCCAYTGPYAPLDRCPFC